MKKHKKYTAFGRKFPLINWEVYEIWKRVDHGKNIPFEDGVKRIVALARKYGIKVR